MSYAMATPSASLFRLGIPLSLSSADIKFPSLSPSQVARAWNQVSENMLNGKAVLKIDGHHLHREAHLIYSLLACPTTSLQPYCTTFFSETLMPLFTTGLQSLRMLPHEIYVAKTVECPASGI